MSAQDAADIVQMNSLGSEVPVNSGEKKKGGLLWVVLGCVVVGVGLGVFVYQQSLKPAVRPTSTPRPTPAIITPSIAPVASVPVITAPVVPDTNVVTGGAGTVTFPKKGKIRIFHTVSNVQMVMQIAVAGSSVKTITFPAKAISAATPMNYTDSSFEVDAGSVGTVKVFLNNTSGPQLKGWIPPMDANNRKECGVAGGSITNNETQIAYAKTLLAGESFYDYQCWEDDDEPGEYNDVYMLWTYVPSSTTTSPSPVASVVASASPKASVKASPSPSVKASASPSPSVKASTVAAVATPTPSPRAAMPDTSEGVPVTGVFEVTVGTISVGLILLALGLFGLITL